MAKKQSTPKEQPEMETIQEGFKLSDFLSIKVCNPDCLPSCKPTPICLPTLPDDCFPKCSPQKLQSIKAEIADMKKKIQ